METQQSAFQMESEEGKTHCNNIYFYTNAENPINKLRDLHERVGHCSTRMQNVQKRVTSTGNGVVKFIIKTN